MLQVSLGHIETMEWTLRDHFNKSEDVPTLNDDVLIYNCPLQLEIDRPMDRVSFSPPWEPLDLTRGISRIVVTNPFAELFTGLWAISSQLGPGHVPGSARAWHSTLHAITQTEWVKLGVMQGKSVSLFPVHGLQINLQRGKYGGLDLHVNTLDNFTQISMIQEYTAALWGMQVGSYFISVPSIEFAHEYERPNTPSQYLTDQVHATPLIGDGDPAGFMENLEMFLYAPKAIGFRSPFIAKVARPMYILYEAWIEQDPESIQQAKNNLPKDNDWAYAAKLWCSLES